MRNSLPIRPLPSLNPIYRALACFLATISYSVNAGIIPSNPNLTTTCNVIGTNGTPVCNSNNSATNVTSSSFVSTGVGNPIDALTGNKFQQETDIQAIGDTYALRLNRYYNSQSKQLGIFGYGWRSDYEMQLQDTNERIDIIQADGRQYHFYKIHTTDPKINLTFTRYQAKDPSLGYVERTNASDPNKPLWQWRLPNGKRFQFIAHRQVTETIQSGTYRYGQLLSVTENPDQANSPYWELTYDTMGRLAQVRNQTGDTLKFNYSTTSYHLPKIEVVSKSGVSQYFLDKNQNLAQVISATGERTGYQYKDKDIHNLTAKLIYDEQGKSQVFAQWQYDGYDRAISSTHANDVEKVSIDYDKNTLLPKSKGQIFKNIITNSVGEKTVYQYRLTGDDVQLLSVKGAGCATCGETNVSYEYDEVGRLIKKNQLDSQGNIIQSQSIQYDTNGNIEQITEQNSTLIKRWQRFEYNDNRYPTKVTKMIRPSAIEGKQAISEITYNDYGMVAQITENGFVPIVPNTNHSEVPLSRTTKFYYALINGKPQLTRIEKPTGTANSQSHETIGFTWDKLGNNIQAINYSNGLQEHYEYIDIAGQSLASKHTDIDGTVTTLQYDKYGKPIFIQKGNQTLTIIYDDKARPIKWQNQLAQVITAQYDDSKHQVRYTSFDGQTIVQDYDTENRIKQQQLVDNKGQSIIAPTTWQYQFGSLKDQPNNHQLQAVITNTPLSNPIISQVVSKNTSAKFNPQDKLLDEKQKPNEITSAKLNIQGQLEQLTLTTGSQYQRLYDDFGRLVYAKEANTGEHWVEYSLDDNPLTIANEQSRQTIKYDTLNRPIQSSTCSINQLNLCDTTNYHYNNKSYLSSIEDNQQVTQFGYTEQGLLAQETVKFKQTNTQWQTQYTYDDKDRITQVKLPEGATLIYDYNQFSQPITVFYQAPIQHWWQRIIRKINSNYEKQPLIANIQADSGRGILRFMHANGQTVKASYDQAGRLTHWQDGSYQSGINYNRTQQISQVTQQSQTQQLSYDDANRLSSVQQGAMSTKYSYDSNGNRLTYHSNLQNLNSAYQYEPNSDRLQHLQTNNKKVSYQYDTAGNPIQITTIDNNSQSSIRKLNYTPRGQIASINDNNQATASYSYNYAMQRISKTQGNQTTRYLWQSGLLDAEIKQVNGQEKLSRRYIYLGMRPIAVIDYDKDNQANVYSVNTDYLGTPKQVTDNTGMVVWEASHDAFGKVIQVKSRKPSSNGEQKASNWSLGLISRANADEGNHQNAAFEFNLRFAGQYEDSESGYYYNWHRFYNPETGRYLTSDPISLAGGLNTYNYVGQNPHRSVDPWGLYTIFIGGAGDKEDFWYIFPKHYVVRDYSSKFRDDLSSYFQKKLNIDNQRANQLATYNVKYYGYNELDQAYNSAINFLNTFPTVKINIVGHSLGGWQAAQLADKLNSKFGNRCVLSNLITLDPVGTVYSWNPLGSIKFKTPKTSAPVWTNVKADYTGFPSRNNVVAILGGQWNPSSSGLSPTYNYKFVADHLDVDTLMSHKVMVNDIQQNFSPYDLLFKYYQNNLNLINTFQ